MNQLPTTTTDAGPPGRTQLWERTPGRRRLMFSPGLRQVGPNRFEVVARVDGGGVPWGFWGGVMALAVGVVVIGYQGVIGLWSTGNVLVSILAMTIGLLLLRFGRRTSLEEERLAEIDVERGTLRVLEDQAGTAQPVIPFDQVSEIVFGMTLYPVSEDSDAVKVEAYTVMVRHGDDFLIPVVEASSDKDEVYGLARFLARLTGLDITQVGRGIQQ